MSKRFVMTRTPPQLEVHPQPDELAMAYWEMDAHQQVEFWEKLAEIFVTNSGEFLMQLRYVSDVPTVSPDVRRLVDRLGEYLGADATHPSNTNKESE